MAMVLLTWNTITAQQENRDTKVPPLQKYSHSPHNSGFILLVLRSESKPDVTDFKHHIHQLPREVILLGPLNILCLV